MKVPTEVERLMNTLRHNDVHVEEIHASSLEDALEQIKARMPDDTDKPSIPRVNAPNTASFEFVLFAARHGAKIYRNIWKEGAYLTMVGKHLMVVQEDRNDAPYKYEPTHEDILAEDWDIKL